MTITLLIVAGLALLSVRPPAAGDRTPRQVRAAAQAAGHRRIALTVGRIVLVLVLLLLVEALRITWWAIGAAGFVLATIAGGIDLLSRPSPLPAGKGGWLA